MLSLPDFPWDSLAPTKERASAFSEPALGAAGEGLVDLSVGTPVDPTPAVVREALAEASDAHGYPLREYATHYAVGVDGLFSDAADTALFARELAAPKGN